MKKIHFLFLTFIFLPSLSLAEVYCPTTIEVGNSTNGYFTVGTDRDVDYKAKIVSSLTSSQSVCHYFPRNRLWVPFISNNKITTSKRYTLGDALPECRSFIPKVKTSHDDGDNNEYTGWNGRTYSTTVKRENVRTVKDLSLYVPFNHRIPHRYSYYCRNYLPAVISIDFPRQKNDVMVNADRSGFLRDYDDLDGNWVKYCRREALFEINDEISESEGYGGVTINITKSEKNAMVDARARDCISKGWESAL